MIGSTSKKWMTAVLIPFPFFTFAFGLPAASVVDVSPGESIASAVAEARRAGVRTIRLHGGTYPIRETIELDGLVKYDLAEAGVANPRRPFVPFDPLPDESLLGVRHQHQ